MPEETNNQLSSAHETGISILGCGWFGLPLASALIETGYQISGSTTRTSKLGLLKASNIKAFILDVQQDNVVYDPLFFDHKVLLINIPPKRSAGEQASFLAKITHIANLAKGHGVLQVIFISSTAVYGDHNGQVTESTSLQPDTASGKAIVEAEQLLLGYPDFTTTIVRFAGLVGPARDPGRFFSGKSDISNGKGPINLVHLDDCIGVVKAIIDKQAFGTVYNVCAPHHPQRQEFYTRAAERSNLPVPTFKDELLNWKIVESSNVPLLLDYKYKITNWDKPYQV